MLLADVRAKVVSCVAISCDFCFHKRQQLVAKTVDYPVEYLWSHWEQHELPNFCPKSFGELSHHARKALRRMRRRPTLFMAFWGPSLSAVTILFNAR
jgi:hypothetical protein